MKLTYLIIFLSVSSQIYGQTDSLSYEAVKSTVNNLFVAMKESDSSLLRSILDPELRLQTVYTSRKTGDPAMHFGDPEEFIEAVAKPKEPGKEWNEVIKNLQVEIDENLAQVWMEYSFYLGLEYSHCGVNAMQLFWNGESWKIFQITDTRHESCQ